MMCQIGKHGFRDEISAIKTYLINDIVSAAGRVTGNVAQCPDGLLLHVLVRGSQELHEYRDGAGVDHNPVMSAKKTTF